MMMKGKKNIVIATRGSMLALWQAEWIKSELEKLSGGVTVGLKKIKTTGDKILDVPLAQVGGKGLFVKEIEEALLDRSADLAVHSMKDVPTELPAGLHLSAITKREDPRDALIARPGISGIKGLPQGAHVGTSSLRRMCQLLSIRPDIRITQLRGNVDTRIRKLDEGKFDAIILAAAGVKRLGYSGRVTEMIPVETSLPAIAQGAVGIECRVDDGFINELVSKLDHHETAVCVRAERAFLKRLEGGCQVPIAGHAVLEKGGKLVMTGLVGSLSGEIIIKERISGEPENAGALGISLANTLLAKGADKILAEVYGKN
ncbi:MAG: hydroxymethylbilane synthase [Nitrospirae bacterium]|nr:hydroxymethylbilane synthase [Nitrospirota bacterium]